MSTLVAEIRALFTGAGTAVRIAKSVDSSAALQARVDEVVQEVHREVGQVSYAFCKASVAHALGREPSDDEVGMFMTAAVNDAAFPNRAYRLLGEAKKSADQRRRKFLAAMVFGHSFRVLPDDERDRVDMVVERMIPADVELLMRIAETLDRPPPPGPTGFEGRVMGQGNVVAFVRETDLRLVTHEYWNDSDSKFLPEAETDPKLIADRSALTALLSLDCVVLGQMLLGGDIEHHGYLVKSIRPTSLGYLVVRAIDEVRPGLAGAP